MNNKITTEGPETMASIPPPHSELPLVPNNSSTNANGPIPTAQPFHQRSLSGSSIGSSVTFDVDSQHFRPPGNISCNGLSDSSSRLLLPEFTSSSNSPVPPFTSDISNRDSSLLDDFCLAYGGPVLRKLGIRDTRRFLNPATYPFFIIVIISLALGAVLALYHAMILPKFMNFAKSLRGLGGTGYLIMICVLFVFSFPPLVGYGTLIYFCGFVWGFPNGFIPAFFGPWFGMSLSFFLSPFMVVLEKLRTLISCLTGVWG